MRAYDIIYKKRNGKELTDVEIEFMINSYVKGDIPDYQMSAMLMAIFFKGMNNKEIFTLTRSMVNSGDIIDLSSIEGVKVDKHSTGGVGDKTTLIIAPIVAACGVKVAKMSGRGLGHTGGTIDKMESITGLKTNLSQKEFFDIINKVGFSITAQTGNLTPADKKLYALRDVTATVDCIPLIAASIMSKKLSSGSDCILLDVKVGSGAFMKNISDAIKLAEKMVAIGENYGKKTIALITNMDIPLGKNIGNSLEIKEVVDALKGNAPKDLFEICIKLAGNMLYLANKGTLEECENMAISTINSGKAFEKFIEMVKFQGGDIELIKNPEKFEKSKFKKTILSTKDGFISKIDTENLGIISTILGAGRNTKDDKIDFSAGIILEKKVGDFVKKGEILAYLFSSKENKIKLAEVKFLNSIHFDDNMPEIRPFILDRIEKV